MTEEKTLETVVMSQFLSAYKTVQKREKEIAMIPPELRVAMKERLALDQKY